MLKKIVWKNLSRQEKEKILQRPLVQNQNVLEQTKYIIEQVRLRGDDAVKQFTEQYDQVKIENLIVTDEEFIAAEKKVTDKIKNALQHAANQIKKFHQAQLPQNIKVETSAGIFCEMQFRPIGTVGFYIPGGTARLPSTVLMLGIPAAIANCSQRILCSPPQKDGSMDPHILYAAKLCEINKVYKVGGAQAIAAMAYGTQTIIKTDKIFGPGNAWVTQAKILVAQDSQGANYDLPAGPTEQMIIADKNATPAFVAADLLSQAEHGIDSQVILISDTEKFAEQVLQQMQIQMTTLPRKKIIEKSLLNSYVIIVENILEAIEIANLYAPEHLLLQIENPTKYIANIHAAGSVFVGKWAPESVGDYASGTNHVLPTYGFAKNFNGLGIVDFMKRITFQELTEEGLASIATTVETLADIEGLEAHKRAVSVRKPSSHPSPIRMGEGELES